MIRRIGPVRENNRQQLTRAYRLSVETCLKVSALFFREWQARIKTPSDAKALVDFAKTLQGLLYSEPTEEATPATKAKAKDLSSAISAVKRLDRDDAPPDADS
jgi:hypothetical protein